MNNTVSSRCAQELLEGRQNDRPTRPFEGGGKRIVRFRIGRCTEIDCEYDVGYAGTFQPIEQLRMDRTRPGPNTDFRKRLGIDGDQNDIAGCGARRPERPEVTEAIL